MKKEDFIAEELKFYPFLYYPDFGVLGGRRRRMKKKEDVVSEDEGWESDSSVYLS